MPMVPIIITIIISLISNTTNDIQYYITGSDQVWNPVFAGKEYQFLCFAPKNKRFSFSASFGVDSIPDSKIEYYRKRLNMHNINSYL